MIDENRPEDMKNKEALREAGKLAVAIGSISGFFVSTFHGIFRPREESQAVVAGKNRAADELELKGSLESGRGSTQAICYLPIELEPEFEQLLSDDDEDDTVSPTPRQNRRLD